MLNSIWTWLTNTIGTLGYPGIVGLMALESSFFPFPSEIVIPPAGANAHAGEMVLLFVILAGIAGSLIGALFNYWLAVVLGRPFFLRYGKYLLMPEKKFHKMEAFFLKHGEIGTFIGRLVPGVRQYISFPAGLAGMPLWRFCIFTALGSGIWVVVLALIGYYVGKDPVAVIDHAHRILLYMLPAMVLLVIGYVWWYRRKKRVEAPDAVGTADPKPEG